MSNCLARLSIEAEGRGALAEDLAKEKAFQDLKLEEMRKELAVKDELVGCKYFTFLFSFYFLSK